ncbi:MAG: ABC transporter ATP-binding protein [Candidatus Saccharimonadales bacterium]
MDSDTIIKVDHLYKNFKLPHEKTSSIKNLVLSFYKKDKGFEVQKALTDISFEVKKGEFFGIVGRNGSGKSTLLKLIAGIYTPTEGNIHINGSLTPFIELGVGFNPELTGRENIFLNGALLGFSRKEMKDMYKEIVDFAELDRFMDQKLKNYSSGMQVRLAFSIAIRAHSDILLVDEVLAVGDTSFQQKCYDKFEEMQESGRTMILVTHDMSAVQRFCDKALLIENSVIKLIGKPSDVADRYLEQNLAIGSSKNKKENNFSVKNLTLSNKVGETKVFGVKEDLKISFDVINNSKEKEIRIGIQVFNSNGVYCFGTNSKISKMPPLKGKKNHIDVNLEQNLTPGTYHITLAIMNKSTKRVLRYIPKIAIFNIKQETEIQGVSIIDSKWEVTHV